MIERIDCVPGGFPGTYFITVNDDPEHPMSTSCANLEDALHAVADINAAIAEQWAAAPTRKLAIVEPAIDPVMMYAEAMTEANTRFAANQCPLSTGTVTEVRKLKDGRVVRVAMMVELFVDQDALDTYDDDTYGNGGL